MTNRRKKTNNPSLSSQKIEMDADDVEKLNEKVFSAINNLELQKSLDRWLKKNSEHTAVVRRDMSLLKSQISEYMDAFLVFGYNTEGERIILQHFKNAKDRDAIMEFFKTIFLKQQHDNFLDDAN